MSKSIEGAPLGNIETAWDGERLLIIIGCSAERIAAAPKSASGKSYLVASTHGSQQVLIPGAGRARLQINLSLPVTERDDAAEASPRNRASKRKV